MWKNHLLDWKWMNAHVLYCSLMMGYDMNEFSWKKRRTTASAGHQQRWPVSHSQVETLGKGRLSGGPCAWGTPFKHLLVEFPLFLSPQSQVFPPPCEKVAESHISRKLSVVLEKSFFLILICNRSISPAVEISMNFLPSHFYYLTISHHN